MDDASSGILGHGLNVDRVAGAVDNRRRCDSVWTDISARQARGRRFSTGEDPGFPKDRGGTAADAARVHRIHGVVFRAHVQYVFVSLSGDCELAEEECLAVDLAINGELAHFSERRRIHVARGQHRLGGIHAASRNIVMVRDNIGGSGAGARVNSQGSHIASHAASRVTHHDAEHFAAVGRGRDRSRIAGSRGASDVRPVFLPLIRERWRPGSNDTERRGLPRGHSLICRLRINVRGDGPAPIYRTVGRVAATPREG